MTAKIFIDGAAGTTGLEIRERLAGRSELSLVAIDEARRKDPAARRDALNDADVVILCLPDDAAREAVTLITNPNVRVIDASTAHRTQEGWVYGFPEMDAKQREAIQHGTRIANPGCYPTGFIALIRPLIRAGLIAADTPLTMNAVSGYSGGGRAMITEFEDAKAPNYSKEIFRTYGLTLEHKHVDEMRVHAGLTRRPLFAPSVARFYRGMMDEIPLQLWAMKNPPTSAQIHETLSEYFEDQPMIEIAPLEDAEKMKTLDAEEFAGSNRMKLYVFGNDRNQQARLVAVYDNLGKGAAGAAVQNLNVMMGWPETAGLV